MADPSAVVGSLQLPPDVLAQLKDANDENQGRQAFIDSLMGPATAAAKELGVDPRALIAQAALETGWGKSQPGGDSSNLFGIKATNWQGPSVNALTTEFTDGVPAKENAAFRSYATPADSVADYVNLIKNNPRYAKALNSGSNVRNYAEALQAGGYATDPEYANKVVSVADQITTTNQNPNEVVGSLPMRLGPRVGGGRRVSRPSPHTVPEGAERPTGMLGGLMQASGYKDPEYQTTLTGSLGESLNESFEPASGADMRTALTNQTKLFFQGTDLENLEELERAYRAGANRNGPMQFSELMDAITGKPLVPPTEEELARNPRFVELMSAIEAKRAAIHGSHQAIAQASENNPGLWGQAMLNVARGAPATAATIATLAATRNPTAAAAISYGTTEPSAYASLREAGVPSQKAGEAATIEGLISGLSQRVPMGAALKFGTPFSQRLVQTIGAAIPTVSAATIASELNTYAATLPHDMTVADWQEALERGAVKLPATWAAAMIQSAALAGAGHMRQGPPSTGKYQPGEGLQPEVAEMVRAGADAGIRKTQDAARAEAQQKANAQPAALLPAKIPEPPTSGSPSPAPTSKASAPIEATGQGPASTQPAPAPAPAAAPNVPPVVPAAPLTTAPATPVPSGATEPTAPPASPAPPVPASASVPQTQPTSTKAQEPPAGGVVATQPVSNEPTRLELPNRKKGWKGGPDAEIEVVPSDGGFRMRYGMQTPTGGTQTPIGHSKVYPTHDEALQYAATKMRALAEPVPEDGTHQKGENNARKRIREWLDKVAPAKAETRAPTGGDQVTPQPYGSGLSRRGDLRAGMESKIGVGATINELSDGGMDDISHGVSNGKEFFVDSGAFSAFKAAVKAGRPNENESDFTKVIERYNKLSQKVVAATPDDFGKRGLLSIVAPDVVGNQTKTLALIKKHAEDIKGWMEAGHEVIVPFQRGPMKQSDFYSNVAEALGGTDFVVGIPSNAAAMSNEDFAELLSQPYKPDRLHILGAVNSPRMEERMSVIREQYKDDVPGVTSDANLVRSKMDQLYGLKGKARADAIRKILDENAVENLPSNAVTPPPQEAKAAPAKTAKRGAREPQNLVERQGRAAGLTWKQIDEGAAKTTEPDDEVVDIDEDIGAKAATKTKGVEAADAPREDLTEEDVKAFQDEQASRVEPQDEADAVKVAEDNRDPLMRIAARKAEEGRAALAKEAALNPEIAPKRDTKLGRSQFDSVWKDLAPRPQGDETPEAHAKRVERWVERMRNAPVPFQIKIVKTRTERIFGFKDIAIDPNLSPREALDVLLDAYNNMSTHSAFTGLPAEAMGFNGDLSLKLNHRIGKDGTRGLFSMKFGRPFGDSATITLARRSDSFVHEHMHALDFNLLTRYFLAPNMGGLSGQTALGIDLLKQNKDAVDEGRIEKMPEPIRDAFLNFMRAIYLTDDASIAQIGQLSLSLEAHKQALAKAKDKLAGLQRLSNNESAREQRAVDLEAQAAKTTDKFRAAGLRNSAAAIRKRNATLDADIKKARAAVEAAIAKIDGVFKNLNDLLTKKASHLAAASRYVDKLRGGDPYYSQATELMARVGESWIGNRVGQAGGTEFLSGSPTYYNENSSRMMQIVYPNAVDRQRIFQALETLFTALATEQYFEGETHTARIPGDTRIDKELWAEDKTKPKVGVIRSALEATTAELAAMGKVFAAMNDPNQVYGALGVAGDRALTVLNAVAELSRVYYSGRGRVNALRGKYKDNPPLAARIKQVGALITTDPGTKDVQGVTMEREIAMKSQAGLNRVARITEKHDLDVKNDRQMAQLFEELARPHQKVRLELEQALKDVREQLAHIEGDRNKEVQVARMKQQIKIVEDFLETYSKPSTAPDNIRKAADAMRGIYDEIYYDAEDVGIKLGYVSNYQQRTLNRDAVEANPKKFLERAQAVYEFEQLRELRRLQTELDDIEGEISKFRAVERRTGTALPRVKALQGKAAQLRADAAAVVALNPKDQAEEYLYSARTGEMFSFNAATPASKFVKERKFGPIADILLGEFHERNPVESLFNYVTNSARRIAYARRFGDDHLKRSVMLDELRALGMKEPDIDELNKTINGLAGFHSSEVSHNQRLALDMLYNSANMALLPLNVFAQLAEPLSAGLRTGRVRDGLMNLGYTIQALVDGGDSAEIAKIADAIGIVSRAGHDMIAMSRLDGADLSKMSRKWMTWFQGVTGVHGYTNASRQASMKLGGMYIKAIADDFLSGNPEKTKSAGALLSELGIEPVDHERFARFAAGLGSLISLRELQQPENHDLKTQYVYAIHGFVDGVIGNPKPSDKPLMSSHPLGRFITALASFQMYFMRHHIIRHAKMIGSEAAQLGRDTLKLAGPGPKDEAKRKTAESAKATAGAASKFILPLLTLMLGTFAARLMKEAVVNRKRAKERLENFASLQTLTDAADLTGVTGRSTQLYNYLFPNKYDQKSLSSVIAGPYLGFYFDSVDDIRNGLQDKQDPNDTSNAGERKAARAFYRLTVNTLAPPLLSAVGLNGPIGFLTQGGVTSRQMQDAFVDRYFPPTVSEQYQDMQRQQKKAEDSMLTPAERAFMNQDKAEDRADREEEMQDELDDFEISGVTP